MGTTVSVVLPVYNEAENLDVLVGRLTEALEHAAGGGFEVLFIDDGSFARAGLPAPELTYFNTLLLPPLAVVRWLARARGPSPEPPSDFEKNRPGLANELLARVFALERHLLRHLNLPVGVSLLATLPRAR